MSDNLDPTRQQLSRLRPAKLLRHSKSRGTAGGQQQAGACPKDGAAGRQGRQGRRLIRDERAADRQRAK
eukprot:8897177-Alexandrium_andersonii.AAC.1